jgi:acetyl-CoA acetyltransferase
MPSSGSDDRFEHQVVLSGIGQSAIGRRMGRSDIDLTVDAVLSAVADAGLDLSDVDGLVAWPGEHPAPPGFTGPGVWRTADALNLQLTWHHSVVEGPGQASSLMTAMMAVASGLVRHVVVYRTVTESQGQMGGGRSGAHPADAGGVSGLLQWLRPFGSVTAATWLAVHFQRYMHDHGITREQVAWMPVTQRSNALRRGTSWTPEALTGADDMRARMIATPFCLYDCDVPIDACTAFVISHAAYGPDAPHPVRIEAIGSALSARPLWDQWLDPTGMPMQGAARHMWSRTDLTPADVDLAQVYDGFSFLGLVWLEALGFCGRGEAPSFVAGGTRTAIGGELPVNTAGGQLSQGRLHGFGLIHEAAVQLRGQAGAGQVRGAEVCAVGVGGGPLGGSMLLTAYR